MSPPYGIKNFAGAAVVTYLASGITNSAATFTVTDGSTFPTANFSCVLDEGLGTEEKVFVGSRSGNTFSSVTRGEDGPVAQAHTTGCSVRHCFVAQDAQEANNVASTLTTKGDILVRAAAGGPARLAVGASGSYLRANSSPALGLEYTTDPLEVTDFNAKGDLIAATANDAMALLGVGGQGKVLTATPSAATGLGYDFPTSVFTTTQRDALTGGDLWNGRIIYNSTTTALEMLFGGSWYRIGAADPWIGFTPVVTAGVVIGKTITYAKYVRHGNTVTAQVLLTITGVGTPNTAVAVTLPIGNAQAIGSAVGSFMYQDSGTTIYSGAAVLPVSPAGTVVGQANAQNAYIGQAPAFTTANGDIVSYSITYETTAAP